MLRELLSDSLQLPLDYLDQIARSASHRYKTYSVPKRTGGTRIIHHPARELKVMQRWLLHAVIEKWPVHPSAHGYEKGHSTRSNAIEHAGNDYLLRLDFEDFFPSLSAEDLHLYFRNHQGVISGWEKEDIEFFTSIVCRSGRLTIGAPTSPRLSNVLCREFDAAVTELCENEEVKYTRYADDLFFSSKRPNVLKRIATDVSKIVKKSKCPRNLKLNRKKTHHSSKKGRRVVTGLRLTQYGTVSSGRPLKRYLRSLIYRYDHLDPTGRIKLAGYLAYLRGVEPSYINQLVIKFGSERVQNAMKVV